jgi:hypothetical protein
MPPLGIAPSNAIQPGQVGGGAIPASNPFASSLAPDGKFLISAFALKFKTYFLLFNCSLDFKLEKPHLIKT